MNNWKDTIITIFSIIILGYSEDHFVQLTQVTAK